MIPWMARPQAAVQCPPGLEYLLPLDKIIVKQEHELLEVITGFETNNRYRVLNDGGQLVFHASERSSFLQRHFLGGSRSFEMKLTDYAGIEVINLNRSFKCCLSCGLCCPCSESCLDEVTVGCPSAGTLGYIRQQRDGCTTSYVVQDASDNTVLQIEGPALCCNMSCPGRDVEYKVLSADGQHTVGKISKKWSGFLQEYATDADTFLVTFPMDLLVNVKALLLSATFLIDFMFFEDKQHNN